MAAGLSQSKKSKGERNWSHKVFYNLEVTNHHFRNLLVTQTNPGTGWEEVKGRDQPEAGITWGQLEGDSVSLA